MYPYYPPGYNPYAPPPSHDPNLNNGAPHGISPQHTPYAYPSHQLLEQMPRRLGPPGGAVGVYSSNDFRPLQIREENMPGSATRQVFSVQEQGAPRGQPPLRALLTHEGDSTYMAPLRRGGVTREYEPAILPVDERPVTPELARRFEQISNRRLLIDEDDAGAYDEFFRTHRRVLTDPRITHIRAADRIRFPDVVDVDDGELRVIVVPPGRDRKLGTRGVADCMVIAGRASSLLREGHTVLAMTHYTGIDQRTEREIRPRQILDQVVNKMLEKGASADDLELMLVGGMYTSSANEAHRLFEEEQFLALTGRFPRKFPIVAARIPATKVDTNSEEQTIKRVTADDHNSTMNAVIWKGGLAYAHVDLY